MAAQSALSAGDILRDMMLGNGDIAARVTKVYPVVIASEARLPYLVYTLVSLETAAAKGQRGADAARYEVGVYASSYAESAALAEAVRDALDGAQYEDGSGRRLRSCLLTDASAAWTADAYVHLMTFTVRV